MSKIITIGSCISHSVASNLSTDFKGFSYPHFVSNNRSDQLLHHFIDKNKKQIPLEVIETLFIPKPEYELSSNNMLQNQYEPTIGYSAQNIDVSKPFWSEIYSSKFDVIILDNFVDIGYIPNYYQGTEYYSGASLNFPFYYYSNEDYLRDRFIYGNYLSSEDSATNFIKIIKFLKSHQPSAEIFFLCFHHSTSKNDIKRYERITNFYKIFSEWGSTNKVHVLPPLDVPQALMVDPNEWIHFDNDVYKSIAGLLYLQLNAGVKDLSAPANKSNPRASNPYLKLPDSSFWKRSVSSLNPDLVDPVLCPKFTIGDSDKVATAGSCFAQHISNTLVRNNFNYSVYEKFSGEPWSMDEGYKVFSARYGNVYTIKQLRQLLERSFGVLPSNLEPWIRPDKKYCDPFRPNVQPSGFITASDVLEDRQHHIDCVKKMFLDCDVFIFTLGLTEGWESLEGGITVPIAPGVVGGYSDIEKYRFKNYGHNECMADLSFFIDTLKILNPKVKIILTLSPVSLMATYENRHIICATTYSKSVLRVVAETVSSNRDYVDYFPSYEIITGNHNKGRFYADDLREVTLDGVDHVMKIFCNHYVNSNNLSPSASEVIISSEEMQEYEANISKIICDEELLNVMRKTSSENGK